MPCEILIKAVDSPNPKKHQKGDIQCVRDISRPWGNAEGLPNWIKVRITDATVAEAESYLSGVRDVLDWELVNSNANGRRYKLSIDPKITALAPGRGIRAKLRDYLISEYSASVHSYDPPSEAVLDIPNTDWQALRDDILDRFEDLALRRRYYFSDSAVDSVVNLGGYLERTKAQVAANIVDRLA